MIDRTLILVVLATFSGIGVARAEPDHVFRVATLIPDGSAWGREVRALMRNLESSTNGHVRLKTYFDGVAGDEAEQMDRIRRGQLDGSFCGMLCERVAPSMRIVRLPGMFQNRDEAAAIMNALQPEFEAEAAKAGYVLPVTTGLGPDVYFTRAPIHSMAELRSVKLWRWNIDEIGISTSRAMGLQIVPAPVNDASHGLDAGSLDGMVTVPQAALAWQWLARARYLTDLRGSYLWGCMVLSASAFNALSAEHKTAFRAAMAQFSTRMEDVGRQQDEEVLSGRLRRVGAVPVPVSGTFRSDFFAAAKAARERVDEKMISPALVDRVLKMLADYRAEHLTSPSPGN